MSSAEQLARKGPGGAYRRAVRITGEAGRQQAEMEDDFHHFRTVIRHEGGVIRAVEVDSVRTPWVTCALGATALQALVGRSLNDARLAPEVRNMSCTHMLDQVALAIAHAARGTPRLEYRMEVELDPSRRNGRAQLFRDDVALFDWRLEDDVIANGPLAGVAVATLPKDAAGRLAPDLLEAAVALRRALHIAGGRHVNLDGFPTAGSIEAVLDRPASCYSLQPHIRDQAVRSKGTMRDFSGQSRWPLADGQR